MREIKIANVTAFPVLAKPTTIDTSTFSLSGAGVTNSLGRSLTFNGGSLLTEGNVVGGSVDSTNGSSGGGVGIRLVNGSLDNDGAITGGKGSSNTGRGRNSGVGGAGVSLTNSNFLNRAGATVTGGMSGDTDIQGANGSLNTTTAAGGTGLIMSGGSLDNQGVIPGGNAGSITDQPVGGDNLFAGTGGLGASLTGGTHVNSGTI